MQGWPSPEGHGFEVCTRLGHSAAALGSLAPDGTRGSVHGVSGVDLDGRTTHNGDHVEIEAVAVRFEKRNPAAVGTKGRLSNFPVEEDAQPANLRSGRLLRQ